jgi:hypothetical protein
MFLKSCMQSSCFRKKSIKVLLLCSTHHSYLKMTGTWEKKILNPKSILNNSGFFFLLLLVLLNGPRSPTWLFSLVFYILVRSCSLNVDAVGDLFY